MEVLWELACEMIEKEESLVLSVIVYSNVKECRSVAYVKAGAEYVETRRRRKLFIYLFTHL